MAGEERATPRLFDLLWLLFIGTLALLPPVTEWHKQVILLGIGAFQLLEGQLIRVLPREKYALVSGEALSVLIKLSLATLLMIHTSDVGINSSYYPIYYLPIMTAAMYFGPLGTLVWTLLASSAYCSFLYRALRQYQLTPDDRGELLLRVAFFFLVAMIVNRFVMEYRVRTRQYQILAANLQEANRNLEKAQAEAQRAERLAALGQLSAGLAHEIRNPLGVIKGSAEILSQKLSGADSLARELSGYIYTEVNRLSALVSRFLDFARPSQLALRPQPLAPVVERALKYLIDQGFASKIKVRRDYSENLPPVRLDEDLCEQVFSNLLLNACQAMGEEGGELRIAIRRDTMADHGQIVVEIQDSGPGIPAELREQIFNPFVTTKKSGVGLGLAIVNKIVDAHGGSVSVSSEPGHGATFKVSFPMALEMDQTQPQTDEMEPRPI